jgi:hypothetical protein
MKKSLSLLLTAGALLLIGGCAHTPEAPPREVRFVTEREMVNGCVNLGRVTGSSAYGGISGQQLGKVRAEAEMRDNAARLGADVVLVHSSSGGFWGADSSGDAYRCPPGRTPESKSEQAPPPASAPVLAPAPAPAQTMPAPAPGGCVKDTDCKGDRICESGKCVKP